MTGLQATSPKRSRAFSCQDIFSALESQGKSLSLPPSRACPPTASPYGATTTSLLAPSEVSSPPPFPLSRTPKWAWPLSVFNRFFCSFTSLVLIGTSLGVSSPPPRSGLLRLLSPVLTFPKIQATFASHRVTATHNSSSFHRSHLPRLLSVYKKKNSKSK